MQTIGSRGASRILPQQGFSLFELILVIMISSIVAGLMAGFVKRPMEAYRDLERRATLVDLTESALRRMSRDVRAALPNSMRVSGDKLSLEILYTVDGGRYRELTGTNPAPSNEAHGDPNDWLDFAGDTRFNIQGRFTHLGFTYGTALAAGHRLAIYNTTTNVYTDAATDPNTAVITPSSTTITITDDVDEDQITLSSSFDFFLRSPRQRLYVVETPVSFLCNLGAGTLMRYQSYSIASAQPTNPALAPLSSAASALLANHVGACEFDYDAGTASRAGLLTIALTLTDGGEQVRLLQQVHVDNTP